MTLDDSGIASVFDEENDNGLLLVDLKCGTMQAEPTDKRQH